MVMLGLIRQFEVHGDHIAMVPHRDCLIVTGSEDVDGLRGMASIAEEELQKVRSISGLAFRLVGDDWEPWMPDAGHPHHGQYTAFRIQSFGRDYADQKDLLDKLHEQTGEDTFVATYSGIQDNDTGELFSYAVWPKGVSTLLPKVDKLALLRSENDEPDFLEWDRVVEVTGDFMVPADMYPERFRVDEFPTDGQLRSMGG